MNKQYICMACVKQCENEGGYSACCGADFNSGPDNIIFRPGSPGRKRSSQYRGVCEVFRSRLKAKVWRAQIRINNVTYAIGESYNQVLAARMYDNAIFFLTNGGFMRAGYVPTLNFPAGYANAATRSEPYPGTQRLLKKLESRRALADFFSCRSTTTLNP
jgi:hypothetical protein